VERDTPYIKSYALDFLNVDRDSDSSVNLSTNVLSAGGGGGGSSGGGGGGGGGSSGGGGGSGLNTGSNSSVKTKSTGDFWKSFEGGIQQILTYQEPKHLSENTLQAEANANAAAAPTPTGGAAGASAAPAAPAAAPAAPAPPAAAGGVGPAAKAFYTINRQAGVLTIDATSRQHDLIQRYIDELRKNASAQVLIEAKIIEVDLNDQYSAGINWTTVGKRLPSELGGGAI
jgi:general secretion pathway protein D